MRPTTIAAVGAFFIEGALQVSGYQNIPLAIVLGVAGIGLLIPAGRDAYKRLKGEHVNGKDESEILLNRREKREIIKNISADYLVGLYAQHTEIQADKLAAVYIGKWIKISGTVNNVTQHQTQMRVLIISTTMKFGISMSFEVEWHDRLSTFRKGDPIVVIGQIKNIGHDFLQVHNCELLDS